MSATLTAAVTLTVQNLIGPHFLNAKKLRILRTSATQMDFCVSSEITPQRDYGLQILK